MKVGIRKPNIEKSIKARTTGRVKRTAKRTFIPFYGKKGMGYLKDPERAIKNKVYHKVTVDPLDPLKHPGRGDEIEYIETDQPKGSALIGLIAIIFLVTFIYTLVKLAFFAELHLRPLLISVICLIIVIIGNKVIRR